MRTLQPTMRPWRLIPPDPARGRRTPIIILRDGDGSLHAFNPTTGGLDSAESWADGPDGVPIEADAAPAEGSGGDSEGTASALRSLFSDDAIQAMMTSQIERLGAQLAASTLAAALGGHLLGQASAFLDDLGSLSGDALGGLADQVLSGDLLFGIGARALNSFVFGSLWSVDAESSAGEAAAHTLTQKFGLQAASLATEANGIEKMLVRTFRGEPSDASYPLAVKGSLTDHGGSVIGGAGKTLGWNSAVARFGDQQMCPVSGHAPGRIFEGHALVIVEDMPAARFGHQASCDGAGAVCHIVEPRNDILLGLAPGEAPPPPDPLNPKPNDPGMDLDTPGECTGVGDSAQAVGVNAKPACENHDACYGRRGSPDDRAVCDNKFGDDIASSPSINALGSFFGPIVAAAYEAATHLVGWMFYEYAPGLTDRTPSPVDRISQGLRQAIRKIWNLPNTLIGLVFGGVGQVFGAAAYALGLRDRRPWIDFGHNAIQFHDNPFTPLGAITLGNAIIYGSGLTHAHTDHMSDGSLTVGDHEEQHTLQGEALGPFYLPSNLLGGLAGWAFGESHSWHDPLNWNENGPPQGRPFAGPRRRDT